MEDPEDLTADPSSGGPAEAAHGGPSADYMRRRWTKSRITWADYEAAKQVLLEELAPERSDRVLEIGCGPGAWTREVVPLVRELVAVEVSKTRLEEARAYTVGIPVRFVHGDFLDVPVQGSFNKVFSSRAIEYIPDADRLAEKISRLTAPGGTIVLITKTRFSVWRGRTRLVNRRLLERKGKQVGMGPQTLRSPRDLARAFAPYGVQPVRVRPVVLRPPIFTGGFYELPLISDSLAGPFLGTSRALFRLGSHPPMALAFLPLLLTESYAITLRKPG